jgi:hypothetical protein
MHFGRRIVPVAESATAADGLDCCDRAPPHSCVTDVKDDGDNDDLRTIIKSLCNSNR